MDLCIRVSGYAFFRKAGVQSSDLWKQDSRSASWFFWRRHPEAVTCLGVELFLSARMIQRWSALCLSMLKALPSCC